MVEFPQQVETVVREELDRFRISEMREFAQQHLITPKLHYRRWNYSCKPVSYPCWLVVDFGENDIGIAFSEHGHGTHDPWGVVLISDEWCGRDDSWFLTLEDAVINSGRWRGALPENYEIS
jgi:hypothetical protein